MKVLAVIPSRYASVRLPGKPLADICGKPMVQWVYAAALQVSLFDEVVVATEDDRIADTVRSFGGKVCMTSSSCPSGSDRVIEVARQYEADIYVNVQGDQPLVHSEDLARLTAAIAEDPSIQVASLCTPIPAEQAANPNFAKVVLRHSRDALYFSRSPIPCQGSGGFAPRYLAHIGMYAWRRETLLRYGTLPVSDLEQAEDLEQLRLLQAGISIRMVEVSEMQPEVNTAEDLERVRRIVAALDSK